MKIEQIIAEWLDKYVDIFVEWLNVTFKAQFDVVIVVFNAILEGASWVLLTPPFYVVIAIFAVLAWRTVNWFMALFTIISLLLCFSMNLWDQTMVTVAIVVTSTVLTLLFAIPLGILAGSSNPVNGVTKPVMDFLQTMPAYVYLIPAVALFGIGATPAILAIMLKALPPPVIITNLGMRQVPADQIEVGYAFGATPGQILRKIKIPSAMLTIMAGVNQCLMISLAMAVVAGMIGAGGLGREVYIALHYLNIAKAFDSGIAIVFLAIILDRISSGAVNRLRKGPVQK